MHGKEIRKLIIESNLKLWEVARAYGVTDSYFSKLLRYEFSDENTKRVLNIIESLKKEKACN